MTETADARDEAADAVVGRFNAAWNNHDLDAVLVMISDDCVFDAASPVRPPSAVPVVARETLAVSVLVSFTRVQQRPPKAAKYPPLQVTDGDDLGRTHVHRLRIR